MTAEANTAKGEPASLGVALAWTFAGLGIGFLIKGQCAIYPWVDKFEYRHLCYNDIQPLFGVRGISRGLVPYRDVLVEYPVLTGTFMDLTGRLLRVLVRLGLVSAPSDGAYFALTAILLTPFALAVTLILRPHVTRQRLLVWAVGTPLILYAFHNWDLIAVAAAVWGLAALERRRTATAGAAWALGASAKLFPAFFMPGALLDSWAKRERRDVVRLAAGFLVLYLAVNVPWIVASHGVPETGGLSSDKLAGVSVREPGTNGWMEVWFFHAERYPDFGTVWYWLAKYGRKAYPASFWEPGQPGYRDFVSLA
ncbi:MAG: glycosyltransferase 87 family protein, partial [Actinomycetota bacterium]|nr:glycosyltransferase 87 family protein [Actinomycetota bacterium]